jgi:hypothetical protein
VARVTRDLRRWWGRSLRMHSQPVGLCQEATDARQTWVLGLALGCHRLMGHPENAPREWHLDRSRGLWWQLAERGTPVYMRADWEA